MKMFYNPKTRQMIIVERGEAMSIYLQFDEAPAKKAEEVLKALHCNQQDISACREIFEQTPYKELPKEQGPDRLEAADNPEPADDCGATV